MWKPVLFSLALTLAPGAPEAQEDPVDAAEQLIEEGRFVDGRSLLLETLAETRDLPEQQVRVLQALARFSKQLVGDLDQSATYRRRILELPLSPEHPAVVEAREAIAAQNAQLLEYQAENAILARARSAAGRGDETHRQSCMLELQELCRRHPDYLQLAAAYYYLGELCFLLGRNGEAYRAYDRAIKLRPAIGFHLPAPNRKEWVLRLWVHEILEKASWGFLGIALVVTAILFFVSKPWKWFGLRHAFLSAVLVFAWWLLFHAAVWFTGRGVEIPSEHFQEPVYASTRPGSPFSEVLDTLFLYSLVGLLGTFAFCVATARLRPRHTWSFINSLVSLLLFSSLLAVFYLRHCRTLIPSQTDQRLPLLGGVFCYSDIMGQTPYILINPTAYPGFHDNVLNVDEGEFRDWFEQYAGGERGGKSTESD